MCKVVDIDVVFKRTVELIEYCEQVRKEYGIEKEIAEILVQEEKLCEVMRARNAKPFARVCASLYDAKDCVVAAQAFLKSLAGDALTEGKKEENEL